MKGAAPNPRQATITAWFAQMVGTVVVSIVVLAFVKGVGAPFAGAHYDWQRYIMSAVLGATFPALLYLRRYKARLNADEAALQARNGIPDPAARAALLRSLSLGSALCELPMAVGVLHLFLGGDSKWFIGATLITLAIRLSYRPFFKA